MNPRIALMALATVALSAFAVGRALDPATDGAYQVKYAANLDLQDAVVNMTNTGANNANDICVNAYTFAYDEQLISCCTCQVTRNALWSLSANRDLIANTLTPLGDIARRVLNGSDAPANALRGICASGSREPEPSADLATA